MFDPIHMASSVRDILSRNDKRKYYRFRSARFYGGIATADCVGCCLRCIFCWSWREVMRPGDYGKYYTPEEVTQRLISIAKKKKLSQIRISGNEPTLCRGHLLRVLELIPKNYLFILETNGILIGSDETYAEDLSHFPHLYVRVSLKGTNEEEFTRLTGSIPEGFFLQIKALEHLVKYRVNVHPACMVSFSSTEHIKALRKRLTIINPVFKDFEIEELILYHSIEERLNKLGVTYRTCYRPDSVPSDQI